MTTATNKTAARLELAKKLFSAIYEGKVDDAKKILQINNDSLMLFVMTEGGSYGYYRIKEEYQSGYTNANPMLMLLLKETDIWEIKGKEIFEWIVKRKDAQLGEWIFKNLPIESAQLTFEEIMAMVYQHQAISLITPLINHFGWKNELYDAFVNFLFLQHKFKDVKEAFFAARDKYLQKQAQKESNKAQPEAMPPPPKKQKVKEEPIVQNGH